MCYFEVQYNIDTLGSSILRSPAHRSCRYFRMHTKHFKMENIHSCSRCFDRGEGIAGHVKEILKAVV